ncbi:MAG: hypothetical protein HY261_09875 [Chloroflexi bacterium]|nr:hypothetical protein [Chloroflexota bacterium]
MIMPNGRTLAGSQRPLTRIVLITLVAALVVSAAVAIVFVIRGHFGHTEAKVLGTTGVVAGFGIFTFPCMLHYERGRFTALSAFGIASSLLLACLLIAGIWVNDGVSNDQFWQTVVSVAIAAVGTNHIAVMLFAKSPHRLVRLTLYATLTLTSILALTLIGAVWGEPDSDGFLRFVAVLSILDALGTLSVPIVSRLVGLSN